MTPRSARRFSGILLGLLLAAPGASAGSEIRFAEVAEEWGLEFRHRHGATGEYYMPETMGSGVVVFDFDRDGDADVFFVDSGALPLDPTSGSRSRLFRNDGGAFVDVTGGSGIEVAGYGMGGAAGDVDGDGDPDLFVSAFGPNQLFENRGDGTFVDVTGEAGLGDERFAASAGFADTDRDGDLDLYVTNYVDFTMDHNVPCHNKKTGIRSYCHPDVYEGVPDLFYRNRGDGTFEDATEAAGFAEATGTGLGVHFADIDRDGWSDLYVANDMRPNDLYRNRGDGTFDEVGLISGTALNDRGNPEASMGVEIGDLDGDGEVEIMATHLDLETNALYSHLGSWLFVDRRYPSRLAEPSIRKVGFGILFLDLDNDGDLDVLVANGHIIDNIEEWQDAITFEQPNQVFENLGDGTFEEVDPGLDVVRSSRGSAAADFDLDGDLDVVISNSNDVAEAYENSTEPRGRWLAADVLLPGGRPAVGALLWATTGDRVQVRELRSTSSYLSQSSSTVHLGLGAASSVDVLEIRWPAGERARLLGVPGDRRIVVTRQESEGGEDRAGRSDRTDPGDSAGVTEADPGS